MGASDLKSSRKPLKMISVSLIKELQIALELSERGTKTLCTKKRKATGKQKSTDSICDQLTALENELQEHYDLLNLDMTMSDGSSATKDVVIVKNAFDFVSFIIQKRELDPTDAMVRISIDGGGGFFSGVDTLEYKMPWSPARKQHIEIRLNQTTIKQTVKPWNSREDGLRCLKE